MRFSNVVRSFFGVTSHVITISESEVSIFVGNSNHEGTTAICRTHFPLSLFVCFLVAATSMSCILAPTCDRLSGQLKLDCRKNILSGSILAILVIFLFYCMSPIVREYFQEPKLQVRKKQDCTHQGLC